MFYCNSAKFIVLSVDMSIGCIAAERVAVSRAKFRFLDYISDCGKTGTKVRSCISE